MAKVVNVVSSCSNVGKTFVMEGLIRELKDRGFKVATIKHDVHGFDIDHEGKDTYKHRMAGADTVIISSKSRYAMICEVSEEISLGEIIKNIYKAKDIILVEGYKKSNLRKIEVYKSDLSKGIITPKDKLIAIASDDSLDMNGIKILKCTDFGLLADLIEDEKDFDINDLNRF